MLRLLAFAAAGAVLAAGAGSQLVGETPASDCPSSESGVSALLQESASDDSAYAKAYATTVACLNSGATAPGIAQLFAGDGTLKASFASPKLKAIAALGEAASDDSSALTTSTKKSRGCHRFLTSHLAGKRVAIKGSEALLDRAAHISIPFEDEVQFKGLMLNDRVLWLDPEWIPAPAVASLPAAASEPQQSQPSQPFQPFQPIRGLSKFTLGSKERRLNIAAGIKADGSNGRQLSKVSGAVAAGRRTMLLVRAKFRGQANSAAVSAATLQQYGNRLAQVALEKSYGALDLQITYGGGSGGANCLYELDVDANDQGLSDAPIETVFTALDSTNSGLSADCKIQNPYFVARDNVVDYAAPNSLYWSHVVVFVPTSSVIDFAGIAWRPGSQMVISADAAALTSTDPSIRYLAEYQFNAFWHELLHNLGLGHANMLDGYTGEDIGYGDGTDTMGSVSQLPYVAQPLSMDINAGYKHGLGFLPDSRVADFSYASLSAGTATPGSWAPNPSSSGQVPYAWSYSSDGLHVLGSNVVLGALERQGLRQTHFSPANVVSRRAFAQQLQRPASTSAIGGVVASDADLANGYFDLSFRIPDAQRIPNRWLYGSFRARSSTAKNAIIFNEMMQNWGSNRGGVTLYDDVANILSTDNTLLGESYLYDTVPFSRSEDDADLDPQNLKALVYEFERDISATARKWLISTKGSSAPGAAPLQLPNSASLTANGVALTSADLAAVPLRVHPLHPTTYERVSGRGCTFKHGCQSEPSPTQVSCGSTTTVTLSPVNPAKAFKVAFSSPTSSMVNIQVRSIGAPNGVAIGAYASSFPAAQVLYGADVAVRAAAFSNFSIAKDSNNAFFISNSDVSLTVPMSSNAPYTFAVVGTGLSNIKDTSLLSMEPIYATVTVTCQAQIACDPTNAGLNSGIYVGPNTPASTGGKVGNQYSGYYGLDPQAPVVAGGYLTFTTTEVGPDQMKRSVIFNPANNRWELQYYREYNGLGNVAVRAWSGSEAVGAKSPASMPVVTSNGITCACPENSYLDAGVCKACPNGMVSPPGSSSISACTCDRGFGYDSGTVTCSICPANSFKPTVGRTSCKACANGYVSLPGSTSAAACRMPQYDALNIKSSGVHGLQSGRMFYRSDVFWGKISGGIYKNESIYSTGMPNGLSIPELEMSGGRPVFYANASDLYANYRSAVFALAGEQFWTNAETYEYRWKLLYLLEPGSSYGTVCGYKSTDAPPHTLTGLTDGAGSPPSLSTTPSLEVVASCTVGTYHAASGECRITPAFATVTGTTAASVKDIEVDSLAFATSHLSLNPVSRCPEGYKRTGAASETSCMACPTAYHVATAASGGTSCACPAGYTVVSGNCVPPAQIYLSFNDASDGFGLRGFFNLTAQVSPASTSDLGFGFKWPEYKATFNRSFAFLNGVASDGSSDMVTLFLTYSPWRREWSISTAPYAAMPPANVISPAAPRFGYITNATINMPFGANTLFMFSPYSLDFEPVAVTITAVDLANVNQSLFAAGVPSQLPSASPAPAATATPLIPTPSARPTVDRSKASSYKEVRVNVTVNTAATTDSIPVNAATHGAVLLALRDLLTSKTGLPFDNVQIEGLLLANRTVRRLLASRGGSSEGSEVSLTVVSSVSLAGIPESGLPRQAPAAAPGPAPRKLAAPIVSNSVVYQMLMRVTPSDSSDTVSSRLKALSTSDFSSVLSTLSTVSGRPAGYFSASYDPNSVTVSQMAVTSSGTTGNTTNNGFTLTTTSIIIIAVVGGVLVILACFFSWYCCCRSKKTPPPVIYTDEQMQAAAAAGGYPYQQGGKESPAYVVDTSVPGYMQSPAAAGGQPGFFTPTTATVSVGVVSPGAVPVPYPGTSVVVPLDDNALARQQAYILAASGAVPATSPADGRNQFDYYRGDASAALSASNRKVAAAGVVPKAPQQPTGIDGDEEEEEEEEEDPSPGGGAAAYAPAGGLQGYDYAGSRRASATTGGTRVVADL